MPDQYTAKEIKALASQAKEVYDDTCHHYDEVIYNSIAMYQLRQRFKSAVHYADLFEKFGKTGKAPDCTKADLDSMLNYMKKLQTSVKNYHRKNIKADLRRVEEETTIAREVVAEINTKWLPEIAKLKKQKNYAGLATAVLNMPYKIEQYREDANFGVIRDPRVIKTIKDLDIQLTKIIKTIPAKTYKQVVLKQQKDKMELQRQKILTWIDCFRAKVADTNAFDPETFFSYDFAKKDRDVLKLELRAADKIAQETSELKRLPAKNAAHIRDN